MYLNVSDFKCVTIEHTNKCYARCPQCARTTDDGEVNPNLELKELTLEDYKRIAPPEFYRSIPVISFTGCFGDAIASSNLLEILEYLIGIGASMFIQTNGDFKPPEFFEEIAKLFARDKRERSGIEFSVDGLEDTNHIYRINTDFNRIMKNAEAFINAGGRARWNFILFDHMKHQREQIIQRAKDMGFKSVVIKKIVRRLATGTQYHKNMYERVYHGDDEFNDLLDQYGTYENYVNHSRIECIFKNTGQIYIDHQLDLWPCTLLGGVKYFNMSPDHILKQQMNKLIEKYGEGFNSLKTQTIEDVLNHPWFKNDLVKSWDNKVSDENFKLVQCAKSCGHFIRLSSCAAENKEVIIF